MLSTQKLWFVALSLALMSCELNSAAEVKFCKTGQWPASSIQINLLNGDSRFDDLNGKIERCNQTPVCISFPIVFKMGSWDRYSVDNISDWKTEILSASKLSVRYGNDLWEYTLTPTGEIKEISVYETKMNVRTRYQPCGGILTLDKIVDLQSKSADSIAGD